MAIDIRGTDTAEWCQWARSGGPVRTPRIYRGDAGGTRSCRAVARRPATLPTMRTLVVDHPLIAHKLTALRDADTEAPTFRRLADELVTLLAASSWPGRSRSWFRSCEPVSECSMAWRGCCRPPTSGSSGWSGMRSRLLPPRTPTGYRPT